MIVGGEAGAAGGARDEIRSDQAQRGDQENIGDPAHGAAAAYVVARQRRQEPSNVSQKKHSAFELRRIFRGPGYKPSPDQEVSETDSPTGLASSPG